MAPTTRPTHAPCVLAHAPAADRPRIRRSSLATALLGLAALAVACSAPEAGVGLDSRYLRKSLECWKGASSYGEMVRLLFGEAARGNDGSGDWAGHVGRLQALGAR